MSGDVAPESDALSDGAQVVLAVLRAAQELPAALVRALDALERERARSAALEARLRELEASP